MAFQPDKITREDVIKAINDIENGLIGYRSSTKFDILYRGRTYPPKDVMRQAHKYATGVYEWIPSGGEPTNKYIKALGFEIVNKDLDKYTWIETHLELVNYLIDNENKQVQLIQLLKDIGITGFDDLDVNDTPIPLTEIEPFTFFCYIYKHGPEKRLELLKKLAAKIKLPMPEDELGIPSANAQKVWLFPFKKNRQNNEINRLWTFFKKATYLELDDALFHDILTITNVGKIKITEGLFYFNPIEYFPINGPTKPYLKEVLGIDPEFTTFTEYQSILEAIRDKTNRPFYQISYEAWQWNDNRKNTSYWIFQGNPKIYDAVSALNNSVVSTWTVSAHKDKIKEGDKFILWLTGANAGCYALGTIASGVNMMKEEDAEMSYYLSPTPQVENTRVKVIIDHNFAHRPILHELIKNDETFIDFKGGNQGTNFSATQEQYETFLEFANSDNSSYAAIKKVLDADKLALFLSILKKFVSDNALLPYDERISFNIRKSKNRLVFIIANKYAFAIEKYHSKTIISALSRKRFVDDFEEYINYKGDVEAYWNKNIAIDKFKSHIEEELLFELNKNAKSPFRKFTNEDFINDIFQIKKNMENKPKTDVLPTNQILFGPPGTGKTYSLKNDYFPKYTLKETSITKELYFEETVRSLTWWQVIALALLENGTARVNDILANRWVALKAALSESKNVRATLWGTLQMHTIQESKTVAYTQRQAPFIFDKKEDKSWMLLDVELKEQSPELYDVLDLVNNFKANPQKEIKHYVFTTFHQSFSYEDFIEGIKPKLDDETETNDLSYKIEPGIFKELCSRAQSDPSNRYAIFIDEINRGNVSQIFGELITLIETDKRIGAVNEMKVKLPYSKKEFGVPSNVDIYGTMNTADRSVEALDTALRRRFSFEEMPPQYDLEGLKYKISEYDAFEILKTINTRIEKLIDKDHAIGHSYFLNKNNESIVVSFYKNIIPLLQEYFFGDYGKIGMVLGKGFVRLKEYEKETSVFAYFDTDTANDFDERNVYEIIDYRKVTDYKLTVNKTVLDMNFEKAIAVLMNKKFE